jgi:predicted MPP superfamily phosphohydrolase
LPWFVLLVPVVLLGGLGFWLYRRIAHTPQLGRRGKVATVLGIAVLFGVTLATASSTRVIANPKAWRPLTWTGYVVMALLFYVILTVLVVQVVHGLWRLVDRLRRRTPDRAPRLRRLTAAGLVLALLTTAYGIVEAARPSIRQVTITSADLPQSFDGYRIALITDLHVGPTRGEAFARQVVDMVNAEKPDLIVLGGDMIDGSVAGLGTELAPLSQLRAPDGVVAITGNHEFYYDAADWVAEWKRQGLRVLANDAMVITRGTSSIDVLGVNDLTGTGVLKEDLSAAVAAMEAQGSKASDTSRFRLLLAHQPRQALSSGGLAATIGVDLQLSGHTHGGQMWPFGYVVPLQQPLVKGYGVVGGVPVLVSRGVGAWGPPVRVAAPPEVPLITLRRG